MANSLDQLDSKPTPNHPSFDSLDGQSFGSLKVMGYAGKSYWWCKCECGRISRPHRRALIKGKSKSCGKCKAGVWNIRHGLSGTTEFNSFVSARSRCNNVKNPAYSRYGGRGIRFCFDDFESFIAYLGEKPSKSHSLDRIDNDGNYEPGNVRWADDKQQCRNRRTSRFISAFGESRTLAEWAEIKSVSPSLIESRLDRQAWCAECAIETKAGENRKCKNGFVADVDRVVTVGAESRTVTQWAAFSGIDRSAILARINKCGWCEECAVICKARQPKKCKRDTSKCQASQA